MFTNSLFCDFLVNNGLKIERDGSTKDIICLEFNYGSRSYEQEMHHLRKVAGQARNQYRLSRSGGDQTLITKAEGKYEKITDLARE